VSFLLACLVMRYMKNPARRQPCQGFSASRAEAEAVLFGSDEIAENKMRNAV